MNKEHPQSGQMGNGGPQAAGPASGGPAHAAGVPAPEQITIEQFARLDLRVARIVQAERHPNADRLLKMQIDLGGEQRQLVAGIAAQYRPEDLIGRMIVVVANLKPAVLRGEPSQGMLLAASFKDPDSVEIVSILGPDREVPPGSRIR